MTDDIATCDIITQVGLGGIGSWISPKIARMGIRELILIDDDTVEMHNFENQNYDYPQHIGLPKVRAMEMKLYGFSEWQRRHHGEGMKIYTRQERVHEKTKLSGIVIAAVDSAEARKEIFEAACHLDVPLYIEAAAAEHRGTIRALVPHDPDHETVYRKILNRLSDEEGPPACVSPETGGLFASIIARLIARYRNEEWMLPTIIQSTFEFEEFPTVRTRPVY